MKERPQALLDKAYGFEARGRMDMAEQTWKQVLQADPNNPDALGGLMEGPGHHQDSDRLSDHRR